MTTDDPIPDLRAIAATLRAEANHPTIARPVRLVGIASYVDDWAAEVERLQAELEAEACIDHGVTQFDDDGTPLAVSPTPTDDGG